MKASVVIRTFNSERTIKEVLEAVRSQSFTDYELIVVDSGSTDRTLEILGEYPHTFIDYSSREFTYGGSLNAGIAAANGEYVVCLSSHTLPLSEGWLGALVGAMDRSGEIAGAWGALFFQRGEHVCTGGEVELIDLQKFLERPNRGLQNPNSIIRRSLWEEHHFSETLERCEDQEWAHHFLSRGYRTAIVPGAAAFYRIPHNLYSYGDKTMRDFIVLNELFGSRPGVSTPVLLRDSARATGAMVLGRKDRRAGALFLSSLAGRWTAESTIRYRNLQRTLESSPEARHVTLSRILSNKARRGVEGARRRRRGAPFASGMTGKTRFFIAGEMRSGTSWLARTLDTHPEVFCKGEGSFFGRGQEVEEIPVYRGPTPSLSNAIETCDRLQTWRDLSWNGWARGDDEKETADITRLVIDYYLARDSAASGKKIVGDKSPLHTDHVNEIYKLFPDTKVVHIVRDGRDVAVSLMHHFWRLSEDRGGIFELEPQELEKRDAYYADPEGFLASGQSIFTEERLEQMAVRWGRRVMKASRDGKLSPEGFHQLRYEDLLQDAEGHLSEIFTLLGARADERTIRRCVEENRFERLAKRGKGQEDAASFFRKGVSGDWREVFTGRDREIYESVAGEALRQMGYPLD